MKKLLAILLSLCCLFLVGCNKGNYINLNDTQITQRYTYEDEELSTEYSVWKITIKFIPNYNIENLILEIPIYTYEKGYGFLEPETFNKFELYKAEIKVGTVYRGENYIITHEITSNDYEILKNSYINVGYGEVSVKEGTIIK